MIDLTHVYWLGGSPCSGKSSVAKLLADRFPLRIYHVDDAFNETHRHRIRADRHPTLHKWTTNGWEALWMQPADLLLAEAKAAYGEHFQMILEDLASLPTSTPILVEGTALLPDRVHPLLEDRRRGVWMVPTEPFQRQTYAQRGDWVQMILSQCHDPQQALQNWMHRDVAFARWIEDRARALGLALIQVDGTRMIAHNARRVGDCFGLRGRVAARP